MEILETLAVALGFASLAGVNLYLTVFISGLAVNQQWIDLSAKYPDLLVLGEPAVVITAGLLAAIEFFSDKVPWVDSAWDSVHTVIRPIGGGLLALSAMGPLDPAFAVIIAMLAGGTSLMTHGLKSGTRLAINQSPEPVSNVTASLTEDMMVLGGLAIMSINPTAFAVICIVFIAASIYMAPKIYRRTKAFSWLFWQKIGSVFQARRSVDDLTLPISPDDLNLLNENCEEDPSVNWSMPVIVGIKRRFPKIISNTFGKMFALENDPEAVHFLGRKGAKPYHSRIALKGLKIYHETKFASEDVIFENEVEGRKVNFRLPAGSAHLAEKIIEELTQKDFTSNSNQPVTTTTSSLST